MMPRLKHPFLCWWGVLFVCLLLAAVGCKKPDPPYLQDLKALQKKSHPDTRLKTIARLGTYNTKVNLVAPALAKELRSYSRAVRATAAIALQDLGPQRAVLLVMMQGLSSKHANLRRWSLKGLKRWENDSQHALKQGLTHTNINTRRGATRLVYEVEKLCKHHHQALPKLWEDRDSTIRAAALAATLRWRAPSQPLLRAMAKSWSTLPKPWQHILTKHLKAHISQVVTYAIPLLRADVAKVPVRLGIARIIGLIATGSDHKAPRKIVQVKTPRRKRRRARRMGRLGVSPRRSRKYPAWHPRGGIPPRRKGKIVKSYKHHKLIMKQHSLRWFTPRDIAQRARGIVLAQLSRAWPALCHAASKDEHKEIRRAALITSQRLHQRGRPGPCYTDTLAMGIFDKDPQARQAARGFIKTHKGTSDALLAAAIKLLQRPDAREQRLGLRLLRRFGTEGAKAIPTLAKWLEAGNPDLAALAAKAMGKLGPAAFPPLHKAWQRKDIPRPLRMTLLEALGHVGATQPAYAATLQKATHSQDPIIQVYGVLGLRHISLQISWVVPLLRKLLASPHEALRNAALQTIAAKGKKALTLLPDVLPFLAAKEYDLKLNARRAAAAMACTQPKVLAAIQAGLTARRVEDRVALASALGNCPYKAKLALSPLRTMHKAQNWRERRAALQAYSRLAALPQWLEGSKDPHPKVRAVVTKALQRFQDCPKPLLTAMVTKLQEVGKHLNRLDQNGRTSRFRARQAKGLKARHKKLQAMLQSASMKLLRKKSPGRWYKAMKELRERLEHLHLSMRYSRERRGPAVQQWFRQEKLLLSTLGTLLGGCDAPAWPVLQTYAPLLSQGFRRSVQRRWRERFAAYLHARQTHAGQTFGRVLIERAIKAAKTHQQGTPNTLLTKRFLVSFYQPYPALLPPLLRNKNPDVRALALELWGSWLQAHHPLPMRRRKRAYTRQGLHHRRAVPQHIAPLSRDQQKAALRTLSWALQDKRGELRLQAFRLWCSITTKRSCLRKAASLIKDKDPTLRHEAFQRLIQHERVKHVWKLALRLTRDADAPIRFDALTYCLSVVPRTKLRKVVLRAVTDRSPALRQLAARNLHSFTKSQKKAKAALRKLRGDRDYNVKQSAIYEWRRLFPHDKETYSRHLINSISKNRYKRKYAIRALRRQYRKWLPKTARWLGQQLKVKDPARRVQALQAIRALYTRHAVPYVKRALQDKDKRVVRVARMVLARYGRLVGAAEVPQLCARIEAEGDVAKKIKMLQELRGVIRGNWKPAFGTLQRMLAHPNIGVRVAAVKALLPLGTRGLNMAKAAIRDKAPAVRMAAITLLGGMGLFARHHLQPLLRDPDPAVRSAAAATFNKRRR